MDRDLKWAWRLRWGLIYMLLAFGFLNCWFWGKRENRANRHSKSMIPQFSMPAIKREESTSLRSTPLVNDTTPQHITTQSADREHGHERQRQHQHQQQQHKSTSQSQSQSQPSPKRSGNECNELQEYYILEYLDLGMGPGINMRCLRVALLTFTLILTLT